MSVYHTPEAYGYRLLGQVVWDDNPNRFHVTAVFTTGFGSQVSWGTDQGVHCSTAHPFTGWETCDLNTGSAQDCASVLTGIMDDLVSRRHDDQVAHAAPQVRMVCARLGKPLPAATVWPVAS